MVGAIAVGGMTMSAYVAADAATGGSFDLSSLITGVGLPTAVIVCWVTGLLVSGREHDKAIKDRDEQINRLRQDRDEERSERIRLQTITNERVIPALARYGFVMEAALPLLETRIRHREEEQRLRDAHEQLPGDE